MKANPKRPTLKALANEVSLIRSFVIGMSGKDPEGAYRPEFVEGILRISAPAVPHREFLGPGEFLRRIRSRV